MPPVKWGRFFFHVFQIVTHTPSHAEREKRTVPTAHAIDKTGIMYYDMADTREG